MSRRERYKGNTISDQFQLQRNGVVVNLTGFSLIFNLDTRENPPDTSTRELQINAAVTDAVNGIFEVPWSAGDAARRPGKYYYEIRATDGAGKVETLEKGEYIFVSTL